MLERLRRRGTYANVMSTIAVFGVIAGGGAYAASKIGSSDIAKNAVRSKHIKKRQVKAVDLAKPERLHVVGTPGEAQFFDGGEGDCVWTSPEESGSPPPSFRRDLLGRVQLRGLALAGDGPGGDGSCDSSDPGQAEDAIVFILPARYRPEHANYSTAVGQIVIVPPQGVMGVEPLPPGAVVSALTVAVLDDAEFTPASPATAAAAKAPLKLSLQELLHPGR